MKLIEITQPQSNGANVSESMFGWLNNAKTSPAPPARFPERNDVDGWMDSQVEYFKRKYPDKLWQLFCPSSGDYIPKTVHAGISREIMSRHLDHYRKLKKENPDAVKKALDNVVDYNIYNGGPNEDYPK